jgi:hypothetical protein
MKIHLPEGGSHRDYADGPSRTASLLHDKSSCAACVAEERTTRVWSCSCFAFNQVVVAAIALVVIVLSGCDSKFRSNGEGLSSTQPATTPDTFRPEEVVVPVRFDSRTGAGFIAKMNGGHFFVTNIHVLAVFKGKHLRTVLGQAIELPDECFLSKSRDVALVPVKWDGDAAEVMGGLATAPKAGDPVSAWIPSTDATVSRNEGVVVDILPDVVEVTSTFKPGNSGAPIFHLASGKVLAIASYYFLLRR